MFLMVWKKNDYWFYILRLSKNAVKIESVFLCYKGKRLIFNFKMMFISRVIINIKSSLFILVSGTDVSFIDGFSIKNS